MRDFGILPPPPLPEIKSPDQANGFELLAASMENGEPIEPATMSMKQLGEAVQELRVLLTRLTDLLCRDPAVIQWPEGKIVEVAAMPWAAIKQMEKLQKKLNLEAHRLKTAAENPVG